MMTQEEFMDVMAMKRQDLSIKEIAEDRLSTQHHQQLAAQRWTADQAVGVAGFVPHTWA